MVFALLVFVVAVIHVGYVVVLFLISSVYTDYSESVICCDVFRGHDVKPCEVPRFFSDEFEDIAFVRVAIEVTT